MTRRTDSIALVVSEQEQRSVATPFIGRMFTDPYFGRVVGGLLDVLRPAGVQMMLMLVDDEVSRGQLLSIQNGGTKGYAGYKVADSVNTHEGWGMGSYCYYNVDPTIRQDHGFQAPVKPGVRFHGLLVVSLSGNGQYEHVINNTGSPTSGTSTVPSVVANFP